MRKLISSYLLLPIIVISLSACDPAYIKNVKVTVPAFSQTTPKIVIGPDLIVNVLDDIDVIASKNKITKKDISNIEDPLLVRYYRTYYEVNSFASRGSTSLWIRLSEENSTIFLELHDFGMSKQSQLSQNIEHDLIEVLTNKYGLNYIQQK